MLEALDGVPAHIEEIEFLNPCPIPEAPVRLHTHLIPVPNVPDAYTVTISTRALDNEGVSEVHCRGRASLLGEAAKLEVPLNLSEIDTDRFEGAELTVGSDFYERLEVVLENTFVYGPAFRTIQSIRTLPGTDEGLVEIEMDADLWSRGQAEGMALNPVLLDGLLQVMLSYLLYATDIFSIPLRARRVAFLQPPTSPRLTCYISPQPYLDTQLDAVGQPSVRNKLRELQYSNLGVYDRDTGALVAILGEYTTTATDRSWTVLAKSKHTVSWQPKFMGDGQGLATAGCHNDTSPSGVMEALQRRERGGHGILRVVEWAGCREPNQTALHQCVEALVESGDGTEYWLVADTPEVAQACFEEFHRLAVPLRFEPVDPADRTLDVFRNGLLRRAAAELQLVHGDRVPSDAAGWRLLRRLAVPGGLALVLHEPGTVVHPEAGWTAIRTEPEATLLQASGEFVEDPEPEPCPVPRWVLGEQGSWAASWADRFDAADVHLVAESLFDSGNFDSLEEWPFLSHVQAVDFFCGPDADDSHGRRGGIPLHRVRTGVGVPATGTRRRSLPSDRGHAGRGDGHAASAGPGSLGCGAEHGRRSRRGGRD